MLKADLQAAMDRAEYKLIEDPVCPGVWATGKTLEACRRELESALESWIVFRLQEGFSLPGVDWLARLLKQAGVSRKDWVKKR